MSKKQMEKHYEETEKPNVTFGSSTDIPQTRIESEVSNLSFKRWHKHLQTEHELLERSGQASPFHLWKWYHKCCLPCRWFDSIEYDKKLSKCCLTFRTFKNMGTIFLFAVFFFIFIYSFIGKEALPEGSVFFLFFLFLVAYLIGFFLTIMGLPGMMGHLITGITFGNVPYDWLPARDEEFMNKATKIAEKILLVLALIRAGLLLDLSRIKNRLRFIFLTGTFPFFMEFFVVWVSSHYLLNLEWDWSALLGSTISIVSMATVTSLMDKNKNMGYGEDKHLSTVLIAASVINVLFGLVLFFLCLTYVMNALSSGIHQSVYWEVLLSIIKESFIGLIAGFVTGLLVAFFPDKRNSEAAGLRILIIGLGSFGTTSYLSSLKMNVAAATSCLGMCLICANVWQELGWHQDTNPVLYFYTMAYYMGQPLVLSLIGYEMKLKDSTGQDIGLSLAVFVIGLAGRESVCFLVFHDKSYAINMKEKIFIFIAWLSKGSFQVLLAFSIQPFVESEEKNLTPYASALLKKNSEIIKRTTILGVFILTPLVTYSLTLLTPKLLTRVEEHPPEERGPRGSIYRLQKNRLSISRYRDMPLRKISVIYFSEVEPNESNTAGKGVKKEGEASTSENKSEPISGLEKKLQVDSISPPSQNAQKQNSSEQNSSEQNSSRQTTPEQTQPEQSSPEINRSTASKRDFRLFRMK